ncbi:MAG: LacI family DNA-binding transcriptional regulator [Lachnospiraceae bacterium]|nr:LacI family DNA-binding transcriptional regulator [Lachnospiraceae bacterium]
MEEQEKKYYTIDDVARELGVSKSTVSRAISGKGRIGTKTRERVQRFIEEHDYRPNAVAKGLAQKKTYNLGLLLPMDYAATEYSFFKDCMKGICQEASRWNYDIIISMVEGEELSQVSRLVCNRKVDGVILSRATEHSFIQDYLRKNEMPYLVVGPGTEPGTVYVDNPNEEASRELTEIMLMKGIRRLALMGGKDDISVNESRFQGFVQAHEKMGVPVDASLIFRNVDNHLQAMEAVEASLAAQADGIVCMDDFISNLALGCLREKQVRLPEECRLASFYDSGQMEYNDPPITSVRFDTVMLGRNACRKLLRLLGEETEEEVPQLNYQVILRETTK